MLGNLKEFMSLVQDGLTSNNNIRQTLQEVQKVTNLFNRDTKLPAEALSRSDSQVNFGAGGELLKKYQEDWVAIHDNAEKNAREAEKVDKIITDVCGTLEQRYDSINKLAYYLSCIPTLTATVAEVIDSMKNVQKLMKNVEEELLDYEDVLERVKMLNWKRDHQYHFAFYKDRKMVALEEVRYKLSTEEISKREQLMMENSQRTRDQSSVEFQIEMAKYRISGSTSRDIGGNSIGLNPIPSVSLEQIELDNDPTDLEKFLDS